MKKLIILSIIPFLLSCNEIAAQHDSVEEVKLKQLEGHYNVEDDAWENPNSEYSDYCSFDGGEYATFSKMDQDRNSLGLGLIDKTGKVMVQPIYSSISVGFHNGLCEVSNKEDKRGYVNLDGIEIIKTEYEYVLMSDQILAIDSNLIQVVKNEKYGYINKEGKVIVEIKYNAIDLVGKNRLMFMTEPANWGIMDYAGNVICKPEFTHTNLFENGKMILQKADGVNYIVFENGKTVKQ